jgi:6-phosphogluconate dehydrogenase
MQLGIVGLGRMGGNIARRLGRAGHECIIYDRNERLARDLVGEGAHATRSLEDLVRALQLPRTVWLMLPAGQVTEQVIGELAQLLSSGDIIVDGGNTYYKDDIRRAAALEPKGIRYVDVGTSGGVWGLERGYCMMIGGPREAVEHLDPILAALAPGAGTATRTPGRSGLNMRPEQGYLHAGTVGAGHFVKMIHNGIEYGLMQAYAEGFDILAGRANQSLPERERYDFDLADIAEVWRRGSVISSWLLDLGAIALTDDATLANFTGTVADSGEGRWTLLAAIEEAVPAEVLSAALYARFRSRREHTFAERLLSAMRFQFGGHTER